MSKYVPMVIFLLTAVMLLPFGCAPVTDDVTVFPIITDIQTNQVRAEPDKPAPIIFWMGSDNITHNLIELRGKPILINTWNVDCYECGLEFPYFQKIVDIYSPSGLVFLSINTLDAPYATRNYLANKKYSFTVLLDRKDLIHKKFGLPGTANPYTFLIDSKGVLVSLKIGAFKNSDEIETLLKQNNITK
jgi:peroxiredoxin